MFHKNLRKYMEKYGFIDVKYKKYEVNRFNKRTNNGVFEITKPPIQKRKT